MAARGDEKKRKRPQKQKPGNIPLLRKPFKKSKKEPLPISAASVTPASLLVQDADPDFPRGGRNLLSREEKAEARAEAEAEFEKEEREAKRAKGRGKGKRKVGRKSSGEAEDELGSLFGEGSSGNLPRYANRITLKNISSRMKLWGVIVEVNPKDLVISLPGGLRGFVRAEEVFDVLLDNEYKDHETDLLCRIFHVGQLVSTVVLQVDDDRRDKKGNKRIWLSLRLSLLYKGLTLDAVQDGMVLIAQVKSIEDHGYILHFGVPSFTGFLPRSCLDGAEAIIGQLIQGVVKSIDKARAVVHLNSDSNMVTKSVTNDLKGLSIDQLVPGMMVNARVVSTLENGIMLSFLTYFTGTVDTFHFQESFPSATWKDLYKKNKKVNARILFIDPATRTVGLTLNPHLVLNKHPPSNIKIGDIYDNSRIVRIDRGAGLLVEIPSSPTASPAYVNIIDAADEEVPKLEKKFTEGGQVRVRVLGLRHLEGLSMGSLKASAFEGSVFTHSDVKPGMLVKAKVIAVENFGAIVQFASGVKALCPLPHMSEFDMVKTNRKFKVGAELLFRVLGCKSKRITVTHKKTLVKSKLVVLASYADATVGLVTHGWITKIEKHGCFVRFYNGVQGFTHRSELGLDPGSEPDEMHHIGQVMKCRVISSTPAARKINLSFVISPKRASADDVCQVGSLVSGVVERLTSAAVVIHLKEYGYLKGTIANEHLADHQGQAASLKSLLRPGHEFDRLLILDKEGNNLILSAKYSLVNSAQDIPSDITQVHPSSVVHGYVCNLIETGCFVRFLGRLTGFSPKNKATDEQIDNLSEAFYLGQSVRSHVLSVERETGRMKLSLKQSTCFSMDVSFIRGYFSVEEKIASLQKLDMKNSKPKWIADFKVGTVVEGEIQEIKEFGVILSFKDYPDVVGFIVQHQCGVNVEVGSVVRAFVLDVVMSDGLIDLSLKSELVDSVTSPYKKKRRVVDTITLGLNDTVTALVEIVKENYLVLSIPDHNYAIGYAFAFDYNTQKLPLMHFVNGQRVSVTVGALASDDSSGRLLLLVKSLHVASDTSSSKRLKKSSNYNIGSLVEGEIINIKPLELILKFGNGSHGRLHITEVDDDHFVDHPLSKFRIGEMLKAQIVAKPHPSGKSGKARQWELSVRPSLFSGTTGGTQTQTVEIQKYSSGDIVRGYVVRVDSEWAWLTISRHIMAHLFILDSSLEPNELEEFQKRFRVGEAVEASILSVNEEKKILRIKLCGLLSHGELLNYQSSDGGKENKVSNIHGAEHIQQGDIVSGRIRKVLPGIGGLHVQIGPHLYGRVHYTELTDTWVPHPLSGYQEGQFIKCKVLEISPSSEGFMHVDLSLRASLLGIQSSSPANGVHKDTCNKRFENFDDLQSTMDVQGYVKNVTAKGCFIMLSRRIDARILLSNLSDGYVEDPEKEFPSGKLVCGKVLSVDISSKRVDVTLKSDFSRQRSKDDAVAFDNVHVGDIINGQIRRIESYGLFITIENTSLVGLCHISEISDDHVDNIHDTVHNAGDKVVVKILKVDREKQRISLGMKKSYFANGSDMDLHPIHTNNEEAANDSNYLDLHENGGPSFLGPPLSRASVLPLQVSLDDCENSAGEDVEATRENAANTDVNGKNNQRRMRKKAKEERELEISAAEERFLQMDSPETVDEFEKLVRSSPNSSFVWIKYMAFMLSLADVEKAREIAERALRTINIRDEGEKLNVWVAYFNLENEYGSPPEEAVKKTFQRALQYSDPKKLHFALLGMYERTKQQKLASELLERMTKKFKNSRKVWINHIHCLLKQGKDEIQSIINRALLSLPRHKHIKFLSQTAILEFKCGVPDRGRTMFEGILREYPKKMDLWSIYLDQEIRMQDPEVIRALFERATCLSLPPKKMKFLFKKYLDYEKTHGDDTRIEHVKRKALEYVENLAA